MLIREVVERRINDYEHKEAMLPAQKTNDVINGPNTVTDPSVSLELQESTTLHMQKPVLDRVSSQPAPSQERKPVEEGGHLMAE